MKKVFAKALVNLAAANPKIFLITADLGFGVLEDFADRFPKQFLNIGVAEQNMIGVATGMALEGRIVFVYSIANFPTLRCLEQIRNDACYHSANVKVVAVGGGFSYGQAGISHHATEDLAIMRAMPIAMFTPGDLWEVEQATYAIAGFSGTCYLRLDNSYANTLFKADEKFVVGKARRIVEGSACTIIAVGGALKTALDAVDQLQQNGIKCRLVSVCTFSPLDCQEIFDAAKNTGGIITVEEHKVQGGLGGAVAEACLEAAIIPGFFYRFGLREDFSFIVGNQDYLKNCYNVCSSAIVDMVKQNIKY